MVGCGPEPTGDRPGPKTAAQRQAELYERRRAAGQVRLQEWVDKAVADDLRRYLRINNLSLSQGLARLMALNEERT